MDSDRAMTGVSVGRVTDFSFLLPERSLLCHDGIRLDSFGHNDMWKQLKRVVHQQLRDVKSLVSCIPHSALHLAGHMADDKDQIC